MAHETLLHDDGYPGGDAEVALSTFLDDLFVARLARKQLLRGRLFGGRRGVAGAGGQGFKPRIPERVGRWPEGEQGVLRSPRCGAPS